GATHQGDPPDPSESTRVEWVPIADLRKLIDKGQLTDGPSLIGLSVALAFPPPAEWQRLRRWSGAHDGLTVMGRQAPSSTCGCIRTTPYELSRDNGRRSSRRPRGPGSKKE